METEDNSHLLDNRETKNVQQVAEFHYIMPNQ